MRTHFCPNLGEEDNFLRCVLKGQGKTFTKNECNKNVIKTVGTRQWKVYSAVTDNADDNSRFPNMNGEVFVCAVDNNDIIYFNSEEELLAQYTKDSVECAINAWDLDTVSKSSEEKEGTSDLSHLYDCFAPTDDYDGLVYLSDGVWMSRNGTLVSD